MTDTPPIERVWRMMDMDAIRAEGLDSIAVGLLSEGHTYAVTVVGREHMSVTEMTDALRAALFYLLDAGKADPEMMKGIACRRMETEELTDGKKTN